MKNMNTINIIYSPFRKNQIKPLVDVPSNPCHELFVTGNYGHKGLSLLVKNEIIVLQLKSQ